MLPLDFTCINLVSLQMFASFVRMLKLGIHDDVAPRIKLLLAQAMTVRFVD